MNDELIINYTRFKKTAKLLSRSLDLPHMKAIETLAKVFGYANFQELVKFAKPNETLPIGKPCLDESQLMDRMTEFFGSSCESLDPRLDYELMRLARLRFGP